MVEATERSNKKKISLSSLSLYRRRPGFGDNGVEIHCGATWSRTYEGRLQLLAGHVPSRAIHPLDGGAPNYSGLVALYGQDVLTESKQWRSYARENAWDFASVKYDVEVGRINPGVHEMESLRNGDDRLFVLRRASRQVQEVALDYVMEKLQAENQALKIPDVKRVTLMALRPDLVVSWLLNDPLMAKVEVGVFPVADDPDNPQAFRHFAFVRSGANVTATLQGQSEVDLLLPSWLTDRSEASRLARSERAQGSAD